MHPDHMAAALRGIDRANRMIAACQTEAERLGLDLKQSDLAALLDVALGVDYLPPRNDEDG